jgi:hypothetical protein
MTNPLAAFAAWTGRLDTLCRLMTAGPGELRNSLHEPLPDKDRPGCCVIDGLDLDDALHQRRYRRRRARQRSGTLVTERGWR